MKYGNRDPRLEHYGMRRMLDDSMKQEILSQVFFERVHYEMDWENPKTFNQKIMWAKLYYQDMLITTCCDKYAVKDYVTEKIGAEYIVPTIGAWSNPDDIDFDTLPEKFVLKVNWSSGFNIIVPDKKKLDVDAAKKQLRSWMKPEMNSYYQYFNWGYKHMMPMIYAEEYLEQVAGQVYDYKFFMCGGEMEYLFIATDRHGDHTLTYTFFDKNLEHIPCTYGGKKNAKPLPEMPKNIDKMIGLAKKLAEPFPFVRVDFYEVGDRVYLGEMTFYSGGGVLAFDPEEWDLRLGEKIHFPGRKIMDHESAAFLCEAKIRQVGYKMKENVKALIKKFVRKEAHEGQKYLSVLGVIRLPYKTHTESSAKGTRRYFTLQGVEICYKKMNKSGSDSMQLTYRPCTPLENYMLEGKITPQMQRIHAEQKAYAQMGYFPNLRNPRSLNEKIIWLALNYKNPHIAVAADKGKAKQWLAERIGWEYLIPTIGVYEDVNDIDFNALPEKFVA